ncbi:MAG: exodeoxyribonuclease VII small subunit [Actinomycetaceae bacterium]|nr:exodeoxyribonuclease VII small subunit [Actinomycetaceae bacterium]
MSTTDRPDAATMPYEAARDELVAIVRQLEGGQAPLEDTLELWERGEALAARCRQILEGARRRLETAANEEASNPPHNA